MYGYSDVQIKLREATSNEPTGPTMSQMEYLSSASFSQYYKSAFDFLIIKVVCLMT